MDEELTAALRNSGYDPDQWPIELHLEALRTAERVPVFDLGMCTIRYEESGPVLRGLLAAAADDPSLSDDDATLLFRGLFIIGGRRDTEAFEPLLRLLDHSEEVLEPLLGDLATESLAKIAAGMFDGDAESLFQAIVDPDRDQFVREALLGAATFLTWDGHIAREYIHGFLTNFYEARLAEDQDQAWIGWLTAIALLGMRDLEPLVRRAWDQGRIEKQVLYYSDFENDLDAAELSPDDVGRFHEANLGYIDDVLVEMDWVRATEVLDDEYDYGDGPDDSPDHPDYPGEPVINPLRHVGRNNLCPCGSGKKAKKCCLGPAAGGAEPIGQRD